MLHLINTHCYPGIPQVRIVAVLEHRSKTLCVLIHISHAFDVWEPALPLGVGESRRLLFFLPVQLSDWDGCGQSESVKREGGGSLMFLQRLAHAPCKTDAVEEQPLADSPSSRDIVSRWLPDCRVPLRQSQKAIKDY